MNPRSLSAVLVSAIVILPLLAITGQEKKSEPAEAQAPAAILKSPVGTLLVGDGAGKWSTPSLYDYVPVGKPFLALPGARAMMDLPKAGAQLILWGNLPDLSPSPALESVATLQTAKDFDVELILDRGRIMIENQRKEGPVKTRIRLGKDDLDVTLISPKSAIVLERIFPSLAGVPFHSKPKEPRQVEAQILLLIVGGKVEMTWHEEKNALQGPAIFHGPGRLNGGPVKDLKDLPWLKPGADRSERTTQWHKAIESFRRLLGEHKSLADALQAGSKQKEPKDRSVAVLAATAAQSWPLALDGFKDKSVETRQSTTMALRHQAGRGTQTDLAIYKALLDDKFAPGQAQITMELLHGFTPQQARPETYEALVNYLQHQQPAIRELAAANLYALVPEGKNIAYDASASSEERARAQAAWHKLMPGGKLSP